MLESDIDYFPYIHKIGGNENENKRESILYFIVVRIDSLSEIKRLPLPLPIGFQLEFLHL